MTIRNTTNNPSPLPGKPRDITVTDWIFFVSQPADGVCGELWFETEHGPSSVFITVMEFAEERIFGMRHDMAGEVPVDFEFALTLAIRTKLNQIRAVVAPVFTRKPGPEWGPQPSVLTTYVCPYCGGTHSFVATPERVCHIPDCGGLLGPFHSFKPLPPVTPGKQISVQHFVDGVARVRLSSTIIREDSIA